MAVGGASYLSSTITRRPAGKSGHTCHVECIAKPRPCTATKDAGRDEAANSRLWAGAAMTVLSLAVVAASVRLERRAALATRRPAYL